MTSPSSLPPVQLFPHLAPPYLTPPSSPLPPAQLFPLAFLAAEICSAPECAAAALAEARRTLFDGGGGGASAPLCIKPTDMDGGVAFARIDTWGDLYIYCKVWINGVCGVGEGANGRLRGRQPDAASPLICAG